MNDRHKIDLTNNRLTINRLTNKPYSKSWHTLLEQRNQLPIWSHKNEFMRLLDTNNTLILVGQTGSGKSTQIPQWAIEHCQKYKMNKGVACTQPRRVAAMSVATRVAEEMDVELGQHVGYCVRFESLECDKTILKYMTDGMLLREAMIDANLNSYSVIILDEAHERTLQTEILFGVVKRAQRQRNTLLTSQEAPLNNNVGAVPGKIQRPLKVIVMSATVDIGPFKHYFNAPTLEIVGRQYPVVDMMSETPQTDYVNSAIITVFQIHRTCGSGDILVFCTGQDEIESMVKTCKKALIQAPDSLKNLTVLPLYAALPATHQMKIFKTDKNQACNNQDGDQPGDNQFVRRAIFATNVAETSLTIPNIKYVVDSGKVKSRLYCPTTGLDVLKVIQISKSQAKQRSGRAGRVAPGNCFRLYTQDEYDKMKDFMVPEIKRCNLDGVILQMISMGIYNIGTFEFMDRPDDKRLQSALVDLVDLGAIKLASTTNSPLSNDNNLNGLPPKHDNDGAIKEKPESVDRDSRVGLTNGVKKVKMSNVSINLDPTLCLKSSFDLTKLGRRLSVFPVKPSLAKVIVAANDAGCLDEALTIVSMLYIENLFHIPANKRSQAAMILKKFQTNEGDLIMFLKVFRAFKKASKSSQRNCKPWCNEHFIHIKNLRLAIEVRKQLSQICRKLGMAASSCGQNTEIVRRCLCYGLYTNFAKLINGKYQTSKIEDRTVHIHPSSCLFLSKPEAIIYTEIVETTKCYMRNITLIDSAWIRESRLKNSDH